MLPPVLDRELRVASRKPGTYRLRLFAAAGMLFIWLVLLTGTENVAPGRLGHHVYNALGILALAGCLFSGVFLTADCVSAEKREGTLGLLFLTDLKSSDIVLGKLAATSAQAVGGLLTVLPILGLPLLTGGVTGAEFARLVLVLFASLFWSLTIGLAVSTFSHHARSAMGTTFLVLLLLAGVSPALWWAQKFFLNSPSLDFLLYPSPCYAFMKSQENFYALRSGPSGFWNSLLLISTTGLLCLARSIVRLPKVWQCAETTGGMPWLKQLLFWKTSSAVPKPLLHDMNPIHWLGTRDTRPGRIAARLLLLLGGLWFLFLTYSVTAAPRAEEPFIISIFLLYGLHLMVKVLLTVEASRRVNEDRVTGALELLLVTPLPIPHILSGQHTALQAQFRKALKTLITMNLVMIAAVLFCHENLKMHANDQAIFVELFGGGLLVLLADCAALRWTAIWSGLTSPKHYRAVLATLGRIMVAPWALIFLLVFLRRGLKGPGEAATIFAIWFIISLAIATWMYRASKGKLQTRFRQAAAEY